jgi:hypothetical protein
VETVRESDIEYYGVRDWGRPPYLGANHTWRPERKSWEVLSRLSAFSLGSSDAGLENIHICGEAFSDYHGFIEGALRSAAHVLHRIDNRLPTETPWLCSCEACIRDTARQGAKSQDQGGELADFEQLGRACFVCALRIRQRLIWMSIGT